jgi:hypothetical protein
VGSEPSDASLPVLVAPGLTASAIGHSPQRRAITIHEDTVILFDRLAKTRRSLRGSSLHNALPRYCSTTFCLSAEAGVVRRSQGFPQTGKKIQNLWKLRAPPGLRRGADVTPR